MTQRLDGIPTHHLYPCMVFWHREEHVVTTILGSCVALCLRDPSTGEGGINHYMLALWNGEGLPTPKYGNIAIENLLKRFRSCPPERLEAKLFGGAFVLGNASGAFTVGDRNVQLARELLAEARIRIIAEDTGGDCGRKVIYNTRTGVVLVSRLRSADGRPLELPDGRPR
jgi:chemotaxis protein CheD